MQPSSIIPVADRRFARWADDLATAFVPLEPRRTGESAFHGAIESRDIASIRVSRVEATTHTVMRLRSHIAVASDDICFVNLQLSGAARYLQRRHEQFCGPGDLAVVDTSEPFEIACCRSGSWNVRR